MTEYDRSLVEESVSNYIDYLHDKEEVLDRLKDGLHVTQEIDELITECRLKRQKLGEILHKI